MLVRDFMTRNPVCCQPFATIAMASRLMAQNGCGAIPVVDNDRMPVGLITDRDITCRAISRGFEPATTTVEECMTSPAVTVSQIDSLEQCCELMEEKQIRRLVVTDETGRCAGVIAQADICQVAPDIEAATLLRRISYPPQTQPRATAAA